VFFCVIVIETGLYWCVCSHCWSNKCYWTTNNEKGRTTMPICFYICAVVYL